jgi:hypothetical protein
MTERRPDPPVTWGPARSASAGPPESIEDAAISVDRASSLMADLGFIVFRTPPDSPTPDSCLMVMIQESPTTRHFDPEAVSFWVTGEGRGRIREADRSTRPFEAPFSWGRIRLVDRLGARNSFVSFGGTVTAERVGNGAVLLIFRTPAAIFRLPGHSQRADRLGEEVISFFGRLVPTLWRSPETERAVAATPPLVLYGAFLLHTIERISHSATLRDALASELPALHRQLDSMTAHHPEQLRAAEAELATLGLASPPS